MIFRCALISFLLLASGCSPIVVNVVLPGARVYIGWQIRADSYAGAIPEKVDAAQIPKWEPLVK